MRKASAGAAWRRNLAVMAAAGLASIGAAPAWPQTPPAPIITFQSENPFADFLLGWSPPLFDMGVYAARSLAEITYGQRSYDPVTKSFVVSNLHIRRDATDVMIGTLRMNAHLILFDDVTVDARGLDLAPEVRQSLDRLGLQTVTGNIEMRLRMNDARSAYDIAMHIDIPGAGVMNAHAVVDDFHVLVPLKDIEQTQLGGQPTILGTLVHASFAYQDKGLSKVAYAIAAEQQGVSEKLLQDELASMPTLLAGQALGGLPGGASQHLREQAQVWAHTVEKFLKDRGALGVSFDPPAPVPLSRFQAGILDEALIDALNPTVSNRLDAPAPPVTAPAGSVAAALAEISGIGRPQDIAAGVTALLAGATSGDLDAIDALGSAFAPGMAADRMADDRGLLYAALLVSRARGAAVSDAVLSEAATGLSLDAIRSSEADAAAFFAKTDAGSRRAALTPQTIGTFDADGMRRQAFALYEGRGVPRDLTEAYALALVAAAAGDPIAATLRDDMAAALRRGAIALSAADARTRADVLWAAYSASMGAAQAAPRLSPGAALQPAPSSPAVPDVPSTPAIPSVPDAPPGAN